MTIQEITSKVNAEASARLPEVIGRVFSFMKYRHTHQCWQKECYCDYCRFINGEYVDAKLRLHQLKKRINKIDYWDSTDMEMTVLNQLEPKYISLKFFIKDVMKNRKRELFNAFDNYRTPRKEVNR